MNEADLVSHVAAETSVTRTAAERMVGGVVTAIGDALARGEPVAIAGFGKFATRSRAARRGRNSPNRGTRRHRGLEGAVVQGSEGTARRGQRVACRRGRSPAPALPPDNDAADHARLRHSHGPGRFARIPCIVRSPVTARRRRPRFTYRIRARGPLHRHRRRAPAGSQDVWGREVQSRIRRFAARANSCADQLWTSAPSRAGAFIWRAAGLLLFGEPQDCSYLASRRIAPIWRAAGLLLFGEPQDCSDDSAAGRCARPTHHPLPSRFRRLSFEHPRRIALIRLEELSR